MAITRILLRGGTVLTHDETDYVIPLQADLLISGNRIAKIAPSIEAPEGTTIIDCTDKIVSPGFVDTHHHLWQTLLKGRHADEMLFDYFYTGNFQSSNHSASDMFWGQLGGCLEALDAGTTTVVDHAHLNYSPEHTRAGIAATVASGIRSIFCYAPTPRVDSWDPLTLNRNMLEEWIMKTLEELAAEAPFGDGRVTLGFAFDGWFLPEPVVQELFRKIKTLGIKLTTHHVSTGPLLGPNSMIAKIDSYGLLDSSMLLSHGSNSTAEDVELMKKANAHVSTTPSTELQMGMAEPLAFHSKLDFDSHSSIGIDCHSATSASIPSELKLLLQSSRNTYNSKFNDEGKTPKTVNKTVEEAFNLGTVAGARAVGMSDSIGRLEEGKLADILVFDGLSPDMVCAAQHDPVAAIILHSNPSDIVMSIVDGRVVKDERGLRSVVLAKTDSAWVGGEKKELGWIDVAKELVARRKVLQAKIEKLDLVGAREGTIKAFYINPDNIVDNV